MKLILASNSPRLGEIPIRADCDYKRVFNE